MTEETKMKDYKEKALAFTNEKLSYGGGGWLPRNDPLQRRDEIYLSYVAGYEEAQKEKSTWIKFTDQQPEVGRLIVMRRHTTFYPHTTDDEEIKEVIIWEYDAGILKKSDSGSTYYLEIAHAEYVAGLDEDTEWKYLEE